MEAAGRILVVDDNHDVLNTVSRMLSHLGYDVSSADSGESALRIFLETKFDVVVSDYEMPGMDGVAFACNLKRFSPCTPIVIMTGGGRETVLSRNGAAVDGVLSKPFTMTEIDETIRNVASPALGA